jgi:hypothetical protein
VSKTSYTEDGESTSSRTARRTISSLGNPNPAPPAPTPVSTLHKAARAYAKQGTPIFPCQPDGKAPLHGISIADASVDPEQIDAGGRQSPRRTSASAPAPWAFSLWMRTRVKSASTQSCSIG